VAVRGYAPPEGHARALIRTAAPDRIQLELVSAFTGSDEVLVTAVAGLGAKELIAEHERRLEELTATLGTPQPVVSSLRALAEMLEALQRTRRTE